MLEHVLLSIFSSIKNEYPLSYLVFVQPMLVYLFVPGSTHCGVRMSNCFDLPSMCKSTSRRFVFKCLKLHTQWQASLSQGYHFTKWLHGFLSLVIIWKYLWHWRFSKFCSQEDNNLTFNSEIYGNLPCIFFKSIKSEPKWLSHGIINSWYHGDNWSWLEAKTMAEMQERNDDITFH